MFVPKQYKPVAKKLKGKSGKKRKISPASSPVTVITDIPMGKVELSEIQAISVALIRNELQQEFVAIQRMYSQRVTINGKHRIKFGCLLKTCMKYALF